MGNDGERMNGARMNTERGEAKIRDRGWGMQISFLKKR